MGFDCQSLALRTTVKAKSKTIRCAVALNVPPQVSSADPFSLYQHNSHEKTIHPTRSILVRKTQAIRGHQQADQSISQSPQKLLEH